jgi:hypothetical protein
LASEGRQRKQLLQQQGTNLIFFSFYPVCFISGRKNYSQGPEDARRKTRRNQRQLEQPGNLVGARFRNAAVLLVFKPATGLVLGSEPPDPHIKLSKTILR